MGRLDISTELNMLAAHMVAPREGHLNSVFHVFAYLSSKHNARLIYDTSYPRIESNASKSDKDWRAFYGEMKEAIPPNTPPPKVRSVNIRIYVDVDHAGNMVTRCSRTGYVQFVTNAVVNCLPRSNGASKYRHLEVNSLR
jgi:hypothetical protein